MKVIAHISQCLLVCFFAHVICCFSVVFWMIYDLKLVSYEVYSSVLVIVVFCCFLVSGIDAWRKLSCYSAVGQIVWIGKIDHCVCWNLKTRDYAIVVYGSSHISFNCGFLLWKQICRGKSLKYVKLHNNICFRSSVSVCYSGCGQSGSSSSSFLVHSFLQSCLCGSLQLWINNCGWSARTAFQESTWSGF